MSVPESLVSKLETIPEELRRLKQWVCWRLEERGGLQTKVPYMASAKRHASTTDSGTWDTFEACVHTLKTVGGVSGVGFVFTADDPYCGIDWDKCRADGVVSQMAAQQQKALDSYGEVSQSGTGCHVIIKGTLPAGGRKRSTVEMYDRARFFCMTGERLPWCRTTVEHRQTEIERLHRDIFGGREEAGSPPTRENLQLPPADLNPNATPPFEKFTALLENDKKFRLSWERRRMEFQDQSASTYDMSLAALAVQAEWTPEEIQALLIAARRKFGDDLKRQDYYERTIAKAHKFANEKELVAVAGAESMIEADRPTKLENLKRLLGGVGITRVLKRFKDRCRYAIVLEGGLEVPLGSTERFLSFERFRSAIYEATGVVIRRLKPGRWDAVLEIMTTLVERESEEDSALIDQLRVWVAGYMRERLEDPRAAIAVGKPFVKGSRVYIQVSGFRKHLVLSAMEKIEAPDLRGLMCAAGFVGRRESARWDDRSYCKYYFSHALAFLEGEWTSEPENTDCNT